jgi:hypothetical protein
MLCAGRFLDDRSRHQFGMIDTPDGLTFLHPDAGK